MELSPKGDGSWWTEPIHGGRHVRRVRAEAILLADFLEDRRLGELLILAAELHDLGRLGDFAYPEVKSTDVDMAVAAAKTDLNNLKFIDHAILSAVLFWLMPIAGLNEEEKAAVYFAIANHSQGLVGLQIARAETLGEKLLGLLVICDHADAGITRTSWALKGKPTLSRHTIADLRQYLSGDGQGCSIIPVDKMGDYKNSDLLSCLVYNHQATWPMVEAVRHILPERYLEEELLPRQAQVLVLIERLLELQATQEAA
ncbi:MAG: hypothetical protein V1716_04165 [Candidatus Uhrbacteria bacterium]